MEILTVTHLFKKIPPFMETYFLLWLWKEFSNVDKQLNPTTMWHLFPRTGLIARHITCL